MPMLVAWLTQAAGLRHCESAVAHLVWWLSDLLHKLLH